MASITEGRPQKRASQAVIPANAKTLDIARREEAIAGWLFLAPALIVFLVFLVIPILFALYISFTDWNGITPVFQQARPAVGSATFTNEGSAPVTLEAGTVVSNSRGTTVQFALTEPLTLQPGASAEATLEIVDATIGRAGNIRPGLLDTIEAPVQNVTVTNPAAFTGGQDAPYRFVGVENYNSLLFRSGLAQRDFFTAFKNTLYFVLGVVPTQTVLALLLAVILNQRYLVARGFFRTAFYFPSITSSVVISLIFMWMFTRGGLINRALATIIPNYNFITWLDDPSGVLHNILAAVGITRASVGGWASTRLAGIPLWDWLSGPSVTMFSIMILNTWTTIGTLMVIYLAALQNIPSHVYEAASIDGANPWQIFRKITVPLLAPTTYFVVTLGLIGTFQVFDQIFVISSGGPARTTVTIAYIVYQNGFQNSRMGLAAATALVLFAIIFAFTLLQRRITSERAIT